MAYKTANQGLQALWQKAKALKVNPYSIIRRIQCIISNASGAVRSTGRTRSSIPAGNAGACSTLFTIIHRSRLTRDDLKGPLSVWKYKALLPVSREPVTLKEGGTPVYNIRAIGKDIGMKDAHVKHEGMNPSGSFKDRGMTVGVTKALELGMKSVACASTGNTSASLAVYGARAGIPVIVLLPAGKVALGKVAQALMHGSKVLSIRGNFDDALRLVREMCIE